MLLEGSGVRGLEVLMEAESNVLVISSTNIWQFSCVSEGYKISLLLGLLQDLNLYLVAMR